MLNLKDKDLVDNIVNNLSYDEIFNLIIDINEKVGFLDFSMDLYEHFKTIKEDHGL